MNDTITTEVTANEPTAQATTKAGEKIVRATKQRDAIRLAFAQARVEARVLSPHEVLDKASLTLSGLGIATVYRNIKTLLHTGELRAVALPGEPDRYQLTQASIPTALYITKRGTVFTQEPALLSNASTPPSFQQRTYYVEA